MESSPGKYITRWILAGLALAGFHSAVAQAQNHHSLTNSNHMNALDAVTVDLGSYESSDGRLSP
jgi:hypothetical protein